MDNDDEGLVFDVSENSDTPEYSQGSRELLIFVIDCTSAMFEEAEEGESAFKTSIRCCRSVIMHKIIGSSSDYVGIVFYGTREKDAGDQNPKHVITILEPKQPNADIVKHLDSILKSEDNDNFDNKYGHSDDYSLSDVLWHCSSLISHCTAKVGINKLLLMTCVDHPHRDSPTKQHQVLKKAEDLESLRIQLDIITLKDNFDEDLFYNAILKVVNGPDTQIESCRVIVQELMDGQYRKDCKKRSLGQLTWTLGDDVAMSVSLYCFYSPLKVPAISKLCKRTNESVKSVTQTYHAETGERLLRSDLNQRIEIGDQQLAFSLEEKQNLRIQMKPGITLLGFKSLNQLSPEYHMQKSAFIYPNEDLVKGSTSLFTALLDSCYEKRKFALCYLLSRARGKPRLVALVPQKELRNEVQIMPPGFHVIYLPFAENIREIEVPPKKELDEENVNLCRKILKKVSIKYKVSNFENPKVQTHWACVEALALNYPEKREVVDSIMPNYEFVSQCRLKDLETQFQEAFYADGYDPEAEASKKRKYAAYSQSQPRYPAAKAVKFDPSDPDYVKKMMTSGYGDKLTVPVLKNFLLEKGGINIKGFKKAELLNAVRQELNIED